jgi:hypothetical protein
MMSRGSSFRTVATRRYKRDATTEPMVIEPLDEPQEPIQEKPEVSFLNKWQTIITTTIGELSLSILRGPQTIDGDGQWMPGSCGFFARLSSNCPSSYLSSIKIDKQIVAIFETANTQNKTQKGDTIDELLGYGKYSVNIRKANALEDVHVIKNNRYLFSMSEKDLDEILWWVKLMNYVRSHQDAVIKPSNVEGHTLWKGTAKTYVEIIAKLLVLQPHQDGVCECSPSGTCQPPTCPLVVRKGKIISPADEQRCRQFNALFEGTIATPVEQLVKAARKEIFRKHLNQAIDIINNSCNWKIDKFGTDYNPLCQQDWELEDKRLSTIIYEVLHQHKDILKGLQFHLKKDM